MDTVNRAMEIFEQAVELYHPSHWPEFLDLACGSDQQLRQHVEDLLREQQATAQYPTTDQTLVLSEASPKDDGILLTAHDLSPTSIGQFRLERLVGRGGMGSVFYAYDEQLHRPVALKLPRIDVIGNSILKDRFLQEARIAAGLTHVGLVTIHDFGVTQHLCYLVSEWCPGGDLSSWLKKHSGPVDPTVAAEFVRDLAEAVAYCHDSGVLHLDIKPGNILLRRNNSSDTLGQPLLTDFGLARVLEESLVETHSSLILGTPLYMAPEQAECRTAEIGTAADVYSIGVVLFELLFGIRPFEGDNAVEILDQIRSDRPVSLPRRAGVHRELALICKVCLERNPQDRYVTARQLADDLTRFVNGEPVQVQPVTRRRRMQMALGKPARIWQAGLTTVAIQMPMIVLLLVLWALMAFRMATPVQHSWDQATTPFLLVLVTIHIPSLWTGCQALKYRWWAVPLGLFFSLNFLIPTILVVLGLLKPMSVYDGQPLAAFLMHYSFGVFAAFQTAAYLAAMPAALQQRKRGSAAKTF